MRALGLSFRLPAAVAALVVLAACGPTYDGSAPPAGKMLALTRRDALPPAHAVTAKESWLSPAAAKSKKLLYLSDATNGRVLLVDYDSGTELGYASGFYLPYGLCSDKHGNVFVTDFDTGDAYELQHGTTTVIKEWSGNGEPIGCSVNPRNGDLAITNFYDFNNPSSLGSVVVYSGGGSKGTPYYGPGYDWPAGYDARGNLFVQANGGGQCVSPCLAELPAGGKSWSLLAVSGTTIYFPAAVEWDGTYLGVGDQEAGGESRSAIYQMSVSGGTATVVNTVTLENGCTSQYFDAVQWAYAASHPNDLPRKRATQVATGASLCEGAQVGKWAYPQGGDPIGEITLGQYTVVYGATLVAK